MAFSLEETLDVSEQDTASVFGAEQPLKMTAVRFPKLRQVFTRLNGVTSQNTAIFSLQLFLLSLPCVILHTKTRNEFLFVR